MKAPTSPIRQPRDRRYGWFRKYNDFPNHPKWDLVAAMTCVEKCRVLAIVDCLLISANKGQPRGSIGEFSLRECAACLHIPAAEVDRVYKALEEMAWIDQEHLSTWDKRQPDVEDPTGAERQRRSRAKKRAKRKAERFATIDPTQLIDSAGDPSRVTPLPVTTRLDQTSKEEAQAPSGETMTWEEAERWRKAKQLNLPVSPVLYGQRGNR